MLQLDVFVTFSIGCSLAAAAGDGLKDTNSRTRNKYFVFMLLYFSLIFVPVNMYMLWENTGYKTMFYYDASMQGGWPALYAHAVILAGIAGFMLGRKLVRLNKELTAYSVWIVVNSIWMGAVNSHYDRILYPGGIRDWHNEKKYTLTQFAFSEVALVTVLCCFLTIIPVFYAQMYWPREEGYLTKSRKSSIKWHCTKMYLKSNIVVASVYVVCKLAHITPVSWNWERLGGMLIGQLLFATISLLPIFLMSTKYVVTKKIDLRRSKQMTSPRKRKQRRVNFNNYDIGKLNESDTVDDSSVDNSESGSIQLENNSNGLAHMNTKEE